MVMTIPTNTPLQQQIDEFIAEGASWLPADLLQDLLRPIGQLIHSCAAENALKEGAQAPDFTLPDARGNAVRLSHLLAQGPVVMTFYRGQWCPYCHLALRAYQQALPHLQAKGASLLAISPQMPDHSRALAEKLKLTFALLSDRGNHVARASVDSSSPLMRRCAPRTNRCARICPHSTAQTRGTCRWRGPFW
jgi:AhpC/TSA family